MNRAMKAGIFLAVAGMSAPAYADIWDDSTLGVMPAVMNYTAQEPEGDTEAETTVLPLTISATFDINRITRIVTDARYLDFSIDAESGGIGLSAKGYQLSVQVQREFRWSRNFRPWFGGGIISSVIDMTDRYRTDEDGFLIERLEDRNETTLSALVSTGLEWDLSRDWIIATEARYEHPFTDGLKGYGLAAGFRYRF